MRGRGLILFAIAALAAALPTYARILYYTGNPVFPFFGASHWALPLHDDASLPERLLRLLRVPWDVTFARDRVGLQPPFTPLLIAIVLVVLWASRRDRDARFVALLCAGYMAIFTFLPQDSRYLLPLLPLLCIAAAKSVRSHARLLAAIAIVPALAYAGYCLHREGWPPVTSAERRAYLERRIPEYRALARAEGAPVYVCGAERLNYYGTTGDFNGPLSYARVLHPPDRVLLGRFDYLLVSKRRCDTRVEGLTLVYEDEAAQLWRIGPIPRR
jgi:hypothetical protein